jgi:CheY-like chemotaxis protein
MKNLSDCRVLLVDDAKTNLDILVEALKFEHKLSLALNGETALETAARTRLDLVLLDIVMPGLEGYEVCRRLGRGRAVGGVPGRCVGQRHPRLEVHGAGHQPGPAALGCIGYSNPIFLRFR